MLLTKADAAKLVTGTVTITIVGDDGKPVMECTTAGDVVYRTKRVPVSAETIHGFRVDGDEVVVVTIDGQKLRGPLRAAPPPPVKPVAATPAAKPAAPPPPPDAKAN